MHMKQFFFIFILISNYAFGQRFKEFEETVDSSDWKNIRGKIKDETFFINLNPNGEHYFKRGILKSDMHDYFGALEDFNKSTNLDSTLYLTYYYRGGIKDKLNDFEGSISDYSKVVLLNKEFEWGWNDRGLINFKLGNIIEAETDFKKAIKLKPNWTTPYFNLACLYEKNQEINKAIELYSKSIELDSTNFLALGNIGLIYTDLKKYKNAMYYYTKAINANPKFTHAYILRAEAKFATDDSDGACQDLKIASDMGDESALKHFIKLCVQK